MKTKHTPGPWEVWVDNFDNDYNEIVIQNEDSVIVDRVGTLVSNDATDNAKLMADSKLIAAAPDLLDACKCALADLEGYQAWAETEDANKTIDELREAIQKATD